MGGFFGWFLVIVGVLAIFNAEKLPALRQMLDEKLKGSLDAAKEVSKTTKSKIGNRQPQKCSARRKRSGRKYAGRNSGSVEFYEQLYKQKRKREQGRT